MPDQKLDNLLNLAMDATEEEREKSRNLNVGYEKQTRKWEIIVKYSEMGDSVEVLLGGPGNLRGSSPWRVCHCDASLKVCWMNIPGVPR